MTASTIRYPLSSAHNRKRRSAFTLQDKTTKSKPVLSYIASIDVASSADMSVNEKTINQASTATYDEQLNAIFRESSSGDMMDSRDESNEEDQDMWTLKRASPVIDDDDEEFYAYESPSKKVKTQTICWESNVSEGSSFDLSSLFQPR